MRYLPYQLVQDFFHQQYVNQTNQVFLHCMTTTEQKKINLLTAWVVHPCHKINTNILSLPSDSSEIRSIPLPATQIWHNICKKNTIHLVVSWSLQKLSGPLKITPAKQQQKRVFFCVLFHHKIIWWWHSYQTSTCQGQKSHTHGEDESNQLPGHNGGKEINRDNRSKTQNLKKMMIGW